MQPLGRTPKRFPSKIDNHPPRGYINWWEEENDDGNKAKDKRMAKKEIEDQIYSKRVINCSTDKCGLCGSNNVYQGGSWTPEKCRDCGAVFFMGVS